MTVMIWITMVLSGMLTFAARFSMIGIFKDRQIPDVMRKLLTYVAPSALAAIILPDILLIDGDVAVLDNAEVPAFLMAVGVALFTRNVIVIISSGMAALWLINAFIMV